MAFKVRPQQEGVTDHPHLRSPPSFKPTGRRNSSIPRDHQHNADTHHYMYTSLKDIISAHPIPAASPSSSSLSSYPSCSSHNYYHYHHHHHHYFHYPRVTSSTHGGGGGSSSGSGAIDSSKISIRNQLVKHAASAYLQSAAVLAIPEQSCLLGLWGRSLRSCWHLHVGDPMGACFRSVLHFLSCTVQEMGNVWSQGIRISLISPTYINCCL